MSVRAIGDSLQFSEREPTIRLFCGQSYWGLFKILGAIGDRIKFSGRDLTIRSACFGQRFWGLYEFYLRGIRRHDGRFSIRAIGDCIKFSGRDKTIRWACSVRASRDCIKFSGGSCIKFSGRDPTIRLCVFGQSHWRVYKIL